MKVKNSACSSDEKSKVSDDNICKQIFPEDSNKSFFNMSTYNLSFPRMCICVEGLFWWLRRVMMSNYLAIFGFWLIFSGLDQFCNHMYILVPRKVITQKRIAKSNWTTDWTKQNETWDNRAKQLEHYWTNQTKNHYNAMVTSLATLWGFLKGTI